MLRWESCLILNTKFYNEESKDIRLFKRINYKTAKQYLSVIFQVAKGFVMDMQPPFHLIRELNRPCKCTERETGTIIVSFSFIRLPVHERF